MVNTLSLGRVATVAIRVLRQIRHDRRTLAMLIVMPTLVMVIFGFALSGEVRNIPVMIDNLDREYTTPFEPIIKIRAGEDIEKALSEDSRVKLVEGNYADGIEGVDQGDYYAVLRIPPNLSESLFRMGTGDITAHVDLDIYIDSTKPALKASILAAVAEAMQNSTSVLEGSRSGLEIKEELAFGGYEFSSFDVSIPSVIGYVLTFLVLIVSLLILLRENSMGTLQRLYVTPLTALERLLGYLCALLVVGFLMSGIVLFVGVVFFHATVRGNLVLLFFCTVTFALANVLLAVFLSNYANNELQAIQLALVIAFPSMALAGVLVPVASLPEFIQPLARIIPLNYGNRVFEGVMLKGYGLSKIGGDLLVICIMLSIFLFLAVMTVKDKIDA